ncbi:MAG: hypothetical protein GEU79_02065 [Acidimicrobiia bacterium]|nr:hypothetical protein [Acidimicrobiia bacterium]
MEIAPLDVLSDLSRMDTVMMIGDTDTGKTTMAHTVARESVANGRTVAIVDGDVGHPSNGPPGCVSLTILDSTEDIEELPPPSQLHFVGHTDPSRLALQQVVATVSLVTKARELADLVLLDTTGVISGIAGQTLRYHETELVRPDRIVALHRGGELEPVIGMLTRFFDSEIVDVQTPAELKPSTLEQRDNHRRECFARAFAPPLATWKVRPTVFAPTLPAGLDLSRIDGVLVGIQDGVGACLGVGRLEYGDDSLRVRTNRGEGMSGLRLGSLRIDPDDFQTTPLNLHEVMFGL